MVIPSDKYSTAWKLYKVYKFFFANICKHQTKIGWEKLDKFTVTNSLGGLELAKTKGLAKEYGSIELQAP